MKANYSKIDVTYFHRRPRSGYSFSLEYIFDDIRNRLKIKINPKIKFSKFYNTGVLAKIYNILEAAFSQSKTINHVTGEVHFLNLLMKKKGFAYYTGLWNDS